MKKYSIFARFLQYVLLAAFVPSALSVSAIASLTPRSVLSADADWKFLLGDPAGAELSGYDDHLWRTVTVPHDWSIEGVPAEGNSTGTGGGYYPAGIGWYRKTFTAPAAWSGKRVSLEFDGISMNATVFLNGHKLGFHPYAYTSFRLDITNQVNLSTKNVLAVRVDNAEQPNSRWYSGSGIYRHVRVVVTEPIHIAPWGVFVSTPEASAASARVIVRTQVQNDTEKAESVTVKSVIVSPLGTKSREVRGSVHLVSGQAAETTQQVLLEEPQLWSPEHPRLYRVLTQVIKNGTILDQSESQFGVRSLTWSADKGLLMNGSSIKLAGGSVHHDNGPLGAAAFDRAEERKVQLLKAAGFNAVRTAHNPPSPSFLNACDRLGLLVLDEPFDVWTISKRKFDYAGFFNDWWKQDIDAMVERDRNHPSVIIWGIGNEIPDAWTKEGAPIARQLATRVRSLDPTRPITEAFPGTTSSPNTDAVFSQVDLGGYNYNLAQNQAEDHRRLPNRIMMTTESFPADAFEQWGLVQDHPYIIGEFVWTAMDYLGESGIGAWSYGTSEQATQLKQMHNFLRVYMARFGAEGKNPFAAFQNGQPPNVLSPGYPWHGSYCGDLDLTGFRKPSSYYRDILWNGGNRVYATVRVPEPEGEKILAGGWSVYPTLSSWTWPGQEGKPLTVEVYSGAERVRLFLNDKLIGEKPTGREQAFRAEFEVPYSQGTLRAEGVRGERVVAESALQTAGPPVLLNLTADRTVLDADGQDLAFVTVEAVDQNGRLQPNADQEVHFSFEGAGSIAAIANGDAQSKRSYQDDTFNLFHGRALVVLRTSPKPGQITLHARAEGLNAASLLVKSKPATELPELQ